MPEQNPAPMTEQTPTPSTAEQRTYSHKALNRLAAMLPNWDTYHADPISRTALDVANCLAFVPTSSGGIQIELHADGVDIEIDINKDGEVDVWISRDHRAVLAPVGAPDV